MPTYVVRVWLPDRPGALGSVASRIGAVRGDLVGIDILERGAGRAIDELVVELPEDDLVALLVRELHEVDGVDVEDVRKVSDAGRRDPRLAALETAAAVIDQHSTAAVVETLADRAAREFEAEWVAVVDTTATSVVASVGECPPASWLTAFVAGAASVAGEEGRTGDVALVAFATAPVALVVGRPGRPLRAVERRQLAALAGIADARWRELAD